MILESAAGSEKASPATRYTFLRMLRGSADYAFQPIVNIHTGSVYGYEALLRGLDRLGFSNVTSLFAHAEEQAFLHGLDMTLREMAVEKFCQLPEVHRYRLFFNLDPRVIRQDVERTDETRRLLERNGLEPGSMCLELTESADITADPKSGELIDGYRKHRFQIAIDDFGTGYSGLKLLYEHPPDLLKIDRFFISGIATDHKKRLFVSNTVQLAHVMGIAVVAEGVETEEELMTCKEVGCDLAQGFLIARPTTLLDELSAGYDRVNQINQRNRRSAGTDRQLIEAELNRIEPVLANAPIQDMFDSFRVNKDDHLLPVVDSARHPLGLIHETDIKGYIYSAYGRDLITNRKYRKSMVDFVKPCPIVDIHSSAERLLEAYSASENAAGLIVVEDFRYLGVISATSLIRLIDEKNLAMARDQNPLTKLPGNNKIHEYVANVLQDRDASWHLVYLDFDNFKAFNDLYGFRYGDRAILMFAELLAKHMTQRDTFIGHVGGDDFFVGMRNAAQDNMLQQLRTLLQTFEIDVQSLYDSKAREQGGILARDRYGEERMMPLMRCSAAVLGIPVLEQCGSVEELGTLIAELKKKAKISESGIVVKTYSDRPAFVD